MGCTFRIAAAGNFCDLKRNLVKLKTLSTGVRIFNGAVRTEREFPLKILFLACIQGLVFYLFCGTEIKISPAALRIRFLFTLYQSIFEPLFSHMLQTNSNIIPHYSALKYRAVWAVTAQKVLLYLPARTALLYPTAADCYCCRNYCCCCRNYCYCYRSCCHCFRRHRRRWSPELYFCGRGSSGLAKCPRQNIL